MVRTLPLGTAMSAVAILDLYMAKRPMADRPPALVMHVFDTASADSAPLRTLTSPEQARKQVAERLAWLCGAMARQQRIDD
eukprot:5850787-Prymnesium_polylepis.1